MIFILRLPVAKFKAVMPAKAGIQYAGTVLKIREAGGYWIVRLRGR